MRIIERLTSATRSAAAFNPEVQIAPACILWPDRDRQWEAVIPRLQLELPELLTLGGYAPDTRTGPAIWLRCILAGKSDDVSLPKDYPPIIYLPGVGRQDLRAVESCPNRLKPLAELQYRGVIWSQLNAKDWTILAFLKTDQGGLGLDVSQDNEAKNAMQLALCRLLDEDVKLLKGKRLGKDYFNTLLTGGDPVRDLLQWLDQGDVFQTSRGENEWKAFVEVCKSQLAFNPQNEGALAGAVKLAEHEGPWQAVWERFCEAPKRYPSIPAQIRKCKPPRNTTFWHMDDGSFDGWPQWNEDQEASLHRDLQALINVPAHEARKKLLGLEKGHGRRRSLVWGELGEAPLSLALKHLGMLAETTEYSLSAGTAEDLGAGYLSNGWKADDAVIRALAEVEKPSDFEAISTAIRVVYLPWAEESARHLQKVVDGASYPGGTIKSSKPVPRKDGECILFVDGLRLDIAKRLAEMLGAKGMEVTERITWSALPSVTATGKAAMTPVSDKISGEDSTTDFEPCVAETGQSLKGGYHLKKLLSENCWKVLDRSDNGDGHENAWCEFGDIDHEGHDRGWKLSKHIGVLLTEIGDRTSGLLNAGWKSVRIVTDHGWLLLPGGLPKTEMPSVLTDNKWGRCASLKPGASTEQRLYPWFWNPHQHFVLADGVSCFKKGDEYAHGGLSLQECLTLELTVTKGIDAGPAVTVKFTDVVWKGLRCTVAVDGNFSGLSLDIRTQPGNSLSSVVVGVKPLKDNGTASVVIENEELEGHEATLVLFDANDGLVAQAATILGGGPE
jgi:hypothetical protein